MTHRPIQPIAINGFEPGGTPRAYPIFEDVDPRSLLVDEGYQRDSSERSLKLVRKIVANWDWAKFKAPCAVMTDAGLELIDGQHTAIAAATHPEVRTIPVMIVDVPERKERASAFIGHNKDRVAVTATQLHAAAVAAGVGEAAAIEKVCAESGVRVLRTMPGSGKYKPGQTISVTAIGAMIRARGERASVRVMTCLANAGLAPINQLHVKAGDLLLNDPEYSGQITAETLTATIQAMSLKTDREAAVFRAAHPSTPAWKAVAIVWFRNRRGAKAASNGTEKINTPSAEARTQATSAAYQNRDNSKFALSGQEKSQRSQLKGPAVEKPSRGNPDAAVRQDRPRALLPPERKGESIAGGAKRDDRPEIGRWQPGNHLRRCGPCGTPFVGGRKAEHCADCAYRAEEVMRA